MGIFHMLSMLDVQSDIAGRMDPINRSDGGVGLESPSPTLDELPLGSDNNTWPNVVRNKRNTLYCTTTFKTLGNRMRCVTDFTSSGLLD